MPKPVVRVLGPVAVTLALALAAPAAHATPITDAPVHNTAPIAALHVASSSTTAQTSSRSFDWGSAAIGGGGVLVLVALITAGLAMAGRTRVMTPR